MVLLSLGWLGVPSIKHWTKLMTCDEESRTPVHQRFIFVHTSITTHQDAHKSLVLQVYLGSNTKEFSALLVGFSRRKYWREWEAPRTKATPPPVSYALALECVAEYNYIVLNSMSCMCIYSNLFISISHTHTGCICIKLRRRGSASHETNGVRRTAIALRVTVCITSFKAIVNFKGHW